MLEIYKRRLEKRDKEYKPAKGLFKICNDLSPKDLINFSLTNQQSYTCFSIKGKYSRSFWKEIPIIVSQSSYKNLVREALNNYTGTGPLLIDVYNTDKSEKATMQWLKERGSNDKNSIYEDYSPEEKQNVHAFEKAQSCVSELQKLIPNMKIKWELHHHEGDTRPGITMVPLPTRYRICIDEPSAQALFKVYHPDVPQMRNTLPTPLR